MKDENTCIATVPIGVFPQHKMMSAMVIYVHPEALENDIVNANNYKEHLVFSLYICPEGKLNDPLYALKLYCPSTYLEPIHSSEHDFGQMVNAFAYQVQQLHPEITSEQLENLIAATIVTAKEYGIYIAEQLRCHFE